MKTIILIPPSEGKNVGGEGKLQAVHPVTCELLSSIADAEPQKLYGLKEKALEEAIQVNNEVLSSGLLPTVERYKGVVYKGIDYNSLENKDLFDERVRIVSGLFGLVRPDENIPNYRLKIDKLDAAKLWKPIISELLKDCFVIDLLPQAHKKAVSYDNGIEVEFVIEKDGKKVPAGHNGKFIKGRFVRWLIENDIRNQESFSEFQEDGFVWDTKSFVKCLE